jgi:hypothetical protein
MHVIFVSQELRTALESEKAAFLRIIKSDRAAYEERTTQSELLAMTTAQQLQRAVSFLEELTQHAEQQEPLPTVVAGSASQQQQQQQQPLAAVKAAVQQMRLDCTQALQLTTAEVTTAASCRKPRRPSTSSATNNQQNQKQFKQQRPQPKSALS